MHHPLYPLHLMKKTYNINISGFAFTIDEDAYDILDSYLQTLSEICEKTGQRETAVDIEQRIAEIFSEKYNSPVPPIISRLDVEEVIRRMGAPEEIVDEDVTADEAAPEDPRRRSTPPPFSGIRFVDNRLYRDVDHKVLGGVCAGLAWYLGIDVVWVRIIMVALAFLSGSTMVLIYIILWIVIPAARSPYERMQMMGIPSSMRNVGKVVTGEYSPTNPPCEPGRTPDTVSSVGKVVGMIFTILGLMIVGALLVAFSVAFFGCLIAVCVAPGSAHGIVQAKLVMGCVMGGTLVAGIPLFILFRWLLGIITQRSYRPFTLGQRLCLLTPWILGVAACIVCGILLGHFS